MAISDEIARLQQAKADLKTAIENKGVTVPSSTKLDGYADLVDSIETGGGGVSDNIWYYNSFNAKYKLIGGPDRWDIQNISYLFGYSEDAYFEFNGEKYYIDNFNDGTHTLSKQGQPITCHVSRFVTFIIRKQSDDTYTIELMED